MRLADFAADNPAVCKRLLEVRRRRQWAHAYLLLGDDGPFLERFARTWAQLCACQNPAPDGDACGTCAVCRAIAADAYPDLFLLRPESKLRLILIGDLDKPRSPRGVRHLIRELSLTAAPGHLKIGLVLDADRMNENAQNAFLKTLEEPTADTLLLLTCTNPPRLRPTVRSRCQVIQLLRNRRNYPAAETHGLFPVLARLRAGAGAAVALGCIYQLLSIFARLRQTAEAAAAEPRDPALEEMAGADKTLRKQLDDEQSTAIEAEYLRLRQEITDATYCWFQQQVLLAAGTPPDRLPNPEMLTAAGTEFATAPPASREEADRCCRLTAEMLQALAANVDERLCLESFCLSLCERPVPLVAPRS